MVTPDDVPILSAPFLIYFIDAPKSLTPPEALIYSLLDFSLNNSTSLILAPLGPKPVDV